jgi:hypothetical protein
MTVFLTLGVYSINVSSNFPLQSTYIPTINIYFLLGVLYTFFSLGWFTISEYLRGLEVLPKLLLHIARISKFIFCFESNSTKITDKSKIGRTVKIFSKVQNMNCNKCEACENCLKNEETENIRKAHTMENLMNIKALNSLAFWIIFLAQFISYMIIWISLAA